MAHKDQSELGSTPPPASGTPPRPAATPASGLYTQESASALKEHTDMKRSAIVAGLSIEGKINGNGRICAWPLPLILPSMGLQR